ncbi:MAG: DUF1566 domain-containing protein [Deltaproteobacteria bacterium]|nr:DUF1566 domain-containing protein [Deltaproteobacteria bacterium]
MNGQSYLQTGQTTCHDILGRRIPCSGTGQDGEFFQGKPWPQPRFLTVGESVIDRLTNLAWLRTADLTKEPVTWDQAIKSLEGLNQDRKKIPWRLPNINELESLVDAGRHSPALPQGHPFLEVREEYWSSTTSMFEPDWGHFYPGRPLSRLNALRLTTKSCQSCLF